MLLGLTFLGLRPSLPVAGSLPAGNAARGEYLFSAADCAGCHTDAKAGGKPLAGGRPLATPFGTFYGPNITPDPATGIGRWSAEEFHRALRQGVSRDGSYLYPVFPFGSFTGMSDGDIADLWAYLRSVPAVVHPDRPHGVGFPFNLRFLLMGWRVLYFSEGPLAPDPKQSPEWNRGRYLVSAVAHCGECHTPRNALGALDESRAFAGVKGGPDGQNAPNITPDPDQGIGKWSIDDIMILLDTGQTPDFDYVGSGMAEVVRGTTKLSDDDRRAIAVYLKSLPPRRGPAAAKSS